MNDGPSGWVMCSGLSGSRRDAARMRSGMWLGTYSPITVGGFDAIPGSLSSIRNNSIELRSITQCSPLIRFAYGLAPGPALTQLSDQPSRRSRYSGGATASP